MLRKKCLESTNRLQLLIRERMKRRYKQCNIAFGKSKIKAIDKVEYIEGRNLLQVSVKEDIEKTVMKENVDRFKLAYSSPLLEEQLCKDPGL